MAFGNYTWWEVETGGSDTNGGGFDQQASNFLTDLAATSANTASPVVTSASYSFQSTDVGAWLFIKAGTNWLTGWYKIASVSAGAATLSAATLSASVFFTNTSGKNFNVVVPNTVAGCASVASPTTGTWGIDYSQQGSAQIAFTDLAIGATNTTATSAAHPFGKQMVGNIINVVSGTGFTVQRVEIISVTGVVATFDKALGTASSTGGSGNLGGALASVGLASGMVGITGLANQGIWVKTGAYSMTVNTINVSGGKVDTSTWSGPNNVEFFNFIAGFGSVRGDNCAGTTRPKITAGSLITGNVNMFRGASNGLKIPNIEIDANSNATVTGFRIDTAGCLLYNCKVNNCTNSGYQMAAGQIQLISCEYTGGTLSGSAFSASQQALLVACNAHDCTCSGSPAAAYTAQGTATVIDCIAYNITGIGFQASNPGQYFNCTAYNCSSDGFRTASTTSRVPGVYVNALAVSCGGKAFGNVTSNDPLEAILINCAGYNNTGGNFDTGYNNVVNFVALTANPFVSAPTNFALNNTAGGGAACRAAGYPGTFPGLASTLAYGDIGAAQHQDSGGSSQYAMAFVG